MNLAQLPNDIWSLLLALPSLQDDLFTLLKVGNRALYGRIVRSCTSYSSPRSLETVYIKSLPSLLKALTSLQSIRISAAGFEDWPPNRDKFLPLLSPTLKTIEITAPGGEWLLVNEFVYKLNAAKNNVVRVSSILPICTLFPALEALKVRSSRLSDVIHVLPSCFSMMPHTLHTLHWDVHIPHFESDLRHLPPGLTSLELKDSITKGNPLPRQLRHLSGVTAASPNEVKKLPGTLTSGDWLHSHTKFSPLYAEVLPTSLTELPTAAKFDFRFNSFVTDGQWARYLPKGLTTLDTHDNILSVETLYLLPRTLISLQFFNLDSDSVTQHLETTPLDRPELIHAPWPPLLSRLTTTAATPPDGTPHPTMGSSIFEFLPRTLRVLQLLGLTITGSLAQSCNLPPRLTDLAFDLSKTSDREPFLPFPQEITNLDVRNLILSKESVCCLPPQLLRLALPTTKISSKFVRKFPRTITHLTVHSISSKSLASLPPGLLSLSSTSIRGSLDNDRLLALPNTLKGLFWAQGGMKAGDVDNIMAIAPRLTTLHVPACTLPFRFFKIIANLEEFKGAIDIAKASHRDIKKLSKNLPSRFGYCLYELRFEKKLPKWVIYPAPD